jgi:hypothetical protein
MDDQDVNITPFVSTRSEDIESIYNQWDVRTSIQQKRENIVSSQQMVDLPPLWPDEQAWAEHCINKNLKGPGWRNPLAVSYKKIID